MSSDPNDLEPRTAGHFLIGAPLTAPIEPNLQDLPDNRLSRWQRIEKLRQLFWKRWQKEYLSSLQQRNKWQRRSQTPLDIGTMVIIRDDNLPPLLWKVGRVAALHPGSDGIVRVISVKTASGITKRDINRVCVLPIDESAQ
jgi:hypothetical protein